MNRFTNFIPILCLICILGIAYVFSQPKEDSDWIVTETSTERSAMDQDLLQAMRDEVFDIPERIEIDGFVFWENAVYRGWKGWYPDMKTYSRQSAIEEDFVVIEVNTNQGIVSGTEIWDAFVEKSRNNVPCFVHIVAEMYEIPKDWDYSSSASNELDLQTLKFADLLFDGEYYYGVVYTDLNGYPTMNPIQKYKHLTILTERNDRLKYIREWICLSIYETISLEDHLENLHAPISAENYYDSYTICFYDLRI